MAVPLCLALLVEPLAGRAETPGESPPALPASCQGGVKATVARVCGEPAAGRLDALWDGYIKAASGEASCLVREANAGADGAGALRVADAACEARVASAHASEVACQAALERPSKKPIWSYVLGVAGTAAALGGVAIFASDKKNVTAGVALVAGGTLLSGAGLLIATW
jgi:hypothetical protein